jgi:mRNA interferase RelE/StbE
MELIYLNSFLKDLKKVKDKKTLQKIKAVLNELKSAENLSSVKNHKKLSGHPSAYRIRIGDYRLGLLLSEQKLTIARFVKRNDIYKLFP